MVYVIIISKIIKFSRAFGKKIALVHPGKVKSNAERRQGQVTNKIVANPNRSIIHSQVETGVQTPPSPSLPEVASLFSPLSGRDGELR